MQLEYKKNKKRYAHLNSLENTLVMI